MPAFLNHIRKLLWKYLFLGSQTKYIICFVSKVCQKTGLQCTKRTLSWIQMLHSVFFLLCSILLAVDLTCVMATNSLVPPWFEVEPSFRTAWCLDDDDCKHWCKKYPKPTPHPDGRIIIDYYCANSFHCGCLVYMYVSVWAHPLSQDRSFKSFLVQ